MQRTDSYTESERATCVAGIYSATFRKSNQLTNPRGLRGSLRSDTSGDCGKWDIGWIRPSGTSRPSGYRRVCEHSLLIPVVARQESCCVENNREKRVDGIVDQQALERVRVELALVIMTVLELFMRLLLNQARTTSGHVT